MACNSVSSDLLEIGDALSSLEFKIIASSAELSSLFCTCTVTVQKSSDNDVIDLSDGDDEIEMVAVVTSDNKKYKCIKLEDEEEIKKRKIYWILKIHVKLLLIHRTIHFADKISILCFSAIYQILQLRCDFTKKETRILGVRKK